RGMNFLLDQTVGVTVCPLPLKMTVPRKALPGHAPLRSILRPRPSLTAQGIAPAAEIVQRRPGGRATDFLRRHAHCVDFKGGPLVATRRLHPVAVSVRPGRSLTRWGGGHGSSSLVRGSANCSCTGRRPRVAARDGFRTGVRVTQEPCRPRTTLISP